MPIPNDEYELAKRLLTEHGETDPDKALNEAVQRIRAEGKAQTTTSAVKRLIDELATVSTEVENFSGIVMGINPRAARTDYIVGTPDGCWSVSGLPDGTGRYRSISAKTVVQKEKRDTGARWVEVNGGDVEVGIVASWADFSKMMTPFGSIKGRNQMVLTSAQVRFVNAANKEKYNPNKPFVKGQKQETRPVWDPNDKSFALRLSLGDGSFKGSVTLYDANALEGLFPEGEITEKFWTWFYNPATPDNARLDELSVSLRGQSVVMLVQASDEINGQKLKAPTLQVRNGGWVMLKDRLVASFGVNPVTVGQTTAAEAPTTTPDGLPAPVTVRGMILDDMETKGEISAADIKNLVARAAKIGKDDKAVREELTSLESEGTFIRVGGKFKKR